MKDILVIDDSPGMLKTIVTTLVRSGYSVRQACDGREGIRMVIAQKPDLIICDIKMPGIDGIRTLEVIRKCPDTAAIPFILMTGALIPDGFRTGMATGADDYLLKPFTALELNAAVKSRLQRVERLCFEGVREMSCELSLRLESFLPVIATPQPHAVAQEMRAPAPCGDPPVFHLD